VTVGVCRLMSAGVAQRLRTLSRAESRVPTGLSRPRLARFAPNRPRCRPA
jgi:hypothetical protein